MAKSTSAQLHPFYHLGDDESTVIGWINSKPMTASWVNSYEGLRKSCGVKVGDIVQFRIPVGSISVNSAENTITARVVELLPFYFRVESVKAHTSTCFAYQAFYEKIQDSKVWRVTSEC